MKFFYKWLATILLKQNRKPNLKERKQISFRVSEDEYLKLQQSAETLNISVPAFVKKRHKVVDWSYQNLIKKPDNRLPKFKHVGANANQIERITQDYQKIGEILEEQQISLNEIENVVRRAGRTRTKTRLIEEENRIQRKKR